MKKKMNIILILLFVICFVGVTFAYYSYSETFNNNFDVGNFNVVIEEVFEENSCLGNYCNNDFVSKEVYVVNKESTDAIVRVSYNEYFNKLNENEYSDILSLTEYSVIKVWTSTFKSDWTYYNGWYYYKKVLPAGEQVQILSGVSSNDCYGVYVYNLDFNIESVQASEEAIKDLWNEDVNIDNDGAVSWSFDITDGDE